MKNPRKAMESFCTSCVGGFTIRDAAKRKAVIRDVEQSLKELNCACVSVGSNLVFYADLRCENEAHENSTKRPDLRD